MRLPLLVPVLVAVLAACGADDDEATDTVPPVITPDEPTTPPSAPRTTPPTVVLNPSVPGTELPVPPASVAPGDTDLDRAIADVVARTGVEPSTVTVVAQDEVTWRDSSIGCPQKGMEYLQVITDGLRIVLEVDGQRYEYHRGGRRDLFYCAVPQPPVGE